MKYGPERFINNVIPDLRDNLQTAKPPIEVRETLKDPSEAGPLVGRLLPLEVRSRLITETADFAPGEYKARVGVGSEKEGTKHAHDYLIHKNPEDLTLYFVDPEHQMAQSVNRSGLPIRIGDLRPKMATLIGMKVMEGEDIPRISLLRYRSEALKDKHLLKMGPQLDFAKEILETGDVPELLHGHENEITFRMNIRPDTLMVQSRYASEAQLQAFLKGVTSSAAVEGKVHSFQVIMRHFLRHLEESHFKQLPSGAHE